MSITEILNSLKEAMNGVLSSLKKMASAMSRVLGSLLDDNPIGWSYMEEQRYAVSVNGRWVDRETDEYSEWMCVSRG